MPLPHLIGVVHLASLPGDPGHDGTPFDGLLELALRDAAALARGGMPGVIVENFGSAPFPKGTPDQPTPPWQTAFLARVVDAVRRETGLPVGVNVLRNDASAALGIAAACGGAFIRVNVHAGAAVTDQGLLEGRAFQTLRERRMLGAEHIAILADVRVKHAAPLVPRPLAEEVRELVERAGADGVIVTGSGTGQPVDEGLLAEAAGAAGEAPVWIGSGLTPGRAHLLGVADGAIVGTWLKEGGRVHAPVDVARVRRLVAAVDEARGGR